MNVHIETLEEQGNHTIAEARMVLPGVQALLGFQLIAVFNQRFVALARTDQALHFLAFLLIVVATGLLMTPAAYHRQMGGRYISRSFVVLSSRLIMVALWSLSMGLALDSFLISQLIFGNFLVAAATGAAVMAMLTGLWFFFPLSRKLKTEKEGSPQ